MKTKKALICTLALTSMFLTGTGVFLSKSNSIQSINHDNTIEIKRLNSSTDPEGHVTYTFSYNVMPATATDMTCAMSLAYSDGADCSQVLNGFLDPTTKTISVTNYAPFDKQIILTINSVADPSIKSTVTIDYEKKVLGGGAKDITISSSWEEFNFDFKQALDVQYSIYSLDKQYNFSLVNASEHNPNDDCFRTSDSTLNTKYENLLMTINHGEIGDRFEDPIAVTQTAISEKQFSPDKWLSMDRGLEVGTQWEQLLSDVVKNKAKLIFQYNLTFDAGNSAIVGGVSNISFDLSAMGYTVQDFYTAVTSVQAEQSSLVF